MSFKEKLDSIVTVVLLIGLFAFGFGIISWFIEILQRYDMPWQIQLITVGLVLILFMLIAAKLFSKD